MSLLAAALVAAPASAQTCRYSVTNLGFMNGPDDLAAIAESGEIVGTRVVRFEWQNGSLFAVYGGYLWTGNALVELPPPAGARHSWARALNGEGLIVGRVEYSDGSGAAAVFRPNEPAELLPGDGTWTPISANGANRLGQIVGAARDAQGRQHAYVGTTVGISRAIQPEGADSSVGLRINSAGLIVGILRRGTASRAFLCTPAGDPFELDLLLPAGSDWILTDAVGISDENVVVGRGLRGGVPSGFALDLFSGADAELMPAIPGDVSASVQAVSSGRRIVGQSYYQHPTLPMARWTAVAWRGGRAIDLNSEADLPSGTWLSGAYAVNSRGQIAARGEIGRAPCHFRLDPVCLEDLNSDSVVDVSDLAILLSCWGESPCGDLDHDGDTDIQDLSLLLAAFGGQC